MFQDNLTLTKAAVFLAEVDAPTSGLWDPATAAMTIAMVSREQWDLYTVTLTKFVDENNSASHAVQQPASRGNCMLHFWQRNNYNDLA